MLKEPIEVFDVDGKAYGAVRNFCKWERPIKLDVYNAVVAGKPWPDQHVDEKVAPAESASKPLPKAADTATSEAGAADQQRLKVGAWQRSTPRTNRQRRGQTKTLQRSARTRCRRRRIR